MKEKLKAELDQIMPDLWNMNLRLYENPELGDQEYEAMKLLTGFLRSHGFAVETGIVNRPTAFRATYKSKKPGPAVCFLAEYDALSEIGHGCGHNLIGTMSTGAGVILSKLADAVGGTVIVLGTPAEETNGAKVPMCEQGIFADIDVALMVHPAGCSHESGQSLAMDALQYAYTGKAAHAASSPEKGINALDSVIQLFNGINALRQHLPSDVRIHGIISEGGKAANIVPDYAVARFYIRASTRERVDETMKKVNQIARGAAMMSGASLEISNYELSYDNMITNQALSAAFTKNLRQISSQPVLPAKREYGSIDMGNVSHVVPAIHPYIGLNDGNLVAHTKKFADKTVTEQGRKTLYEGALALAMTGYDVMADPSLLQAIKDEFDHWKNNKLY